MRSKLTEIEKERDRKRKIHREEEGEKEREREREKHRGSRIGCARKLERRRKLWNHYFNGIETAQFNWQLTNMSKWGKEWGEWGEGGEEGEGGEGGEWGEGGGHKSKRVSKLQM